MLEYILHYLKCTHHLENLLISYFLKEKNWVQQPSSLIAYQMTS